MPHIVVVGTGISGVETAITLARCVPDARVTVVGPDTALRTLPNLVYVPFGMQPAAIEATLAELLDPGIELRRGMVRHITPENRTLTLADDETVEWDELVVAPGVRPAREEGLRLRSLDDALRLRGRLSRLSLRERRTTIAVRAMPGCTWSAPAYEFAFLLKAWLGASGVAQLCDVVVATEEEHPLALFGYAASDIVTRRMRAVGIDVVTGMSAAHLSTFDADLIVDFGDFVANRISGLPHVDADGFYPTDASGRIADHVHVVGDAGALPYKAAFTTAWQAQQVARALGGDPSLLGPEIDGIPQGQCEYQMDLGGSTLRVRFNASTHFLGARADTRAHVTVEAQPPRKLQGLLLRTMLAKRSPLHAIDEPADATETAVARAAG